MDQEGRYSLMKSLYERFAATVRGARALAAARLRHEVLGALHQALQICGMSQSDVAQAVGVRRSAANQVFRGDGNVRINTLADYLHAMGFEADIRLVRSGEPRRAALEQRPIKYVSGDWRIRRPQATSSGIFLTGEGHQSHVLISWTSTPIGTTDSIRLEAEVHPLPPPVPSAERYMHLGGMKWTTT
ncbi:helix-turn-helix transcriptional regulator [Nonomuraea sp. NPDC050404]|uniref:helix-turn-helix domain-containing protein n=1 Tax=Nonomuraea sp. NPDC050404 TaxID=3155783 RepID=UPI00340847B9